MLYNPIAGAGRAANAAHALARALEEDGHALLLRQTQAASSSSTTCTDAPPHADVLVVVGGDGTMRAVAEEAIARRIPVYHVPLGTENLFARQFGMDREVATLRQALSGGTIRAIDTASANGRCLLLMASVGFDAAVVGALALRRSGAIRHTSYILPTLGQVIGWRVPRLTILIDGERIVMERFGTVVIANSPEYALRVNPAHKASVTDGLLDVVFYPLRSRFGLLPWAWSTWRGRHLSHPSLVYRQGREVRIEADHAAVYQLDGDAVFEPGEGRTPAGTPLEVRVDPGSLRVLVPG